MSISPSLQASARSAYRSLFRAASATFSGDERVLNGSAALWYRFEDYAFTYSSEAFLDKTRSAYREGRLLTDEQKYEENIGLAREVALVLRKNIVQGRKVSEQDIWKLHITEETELGDNTSIKDTSNRTAPQKASSRLSTVTGDSETHGQHIPRLNFSELKRHHQKRRIPQLNEGDLDESFVRGSGPGGQSVNKTENCVQILHKPSGIRVSCQETRSLDLNRRIARKLLVEKLDGLHNPGLAKGDMRRARMNERERQKRKKRRKKERFTKISVQEDADNS